MGFERGWSEVSNDNRLNGVIDGSSQRAAEQLRNIMLWGDTKTDDASLMREEGTIAWSCIRIDQKKSIRK